MGHTQVNVENLWISRIMSHVLIPNLENKAIMSKQVCASQHADTLLLA